MSTKQRNTRFAKMTKAQKRVAIAKDVIKQIAARSIKPRFQIYLESPNQIAKKMDIGKQLCDVLPNRPACKVCAIGGMFVAAVGLFNDLPVDETFVNRFVDAGPLKNRLLNFFGREQLREIEWCFEDNETWITNVNAPKHRRDAAKRMAAIMQNIIENKGTFVPTAN